MIFSKVRKHKPALQETKVMGEISVILIRKNEKENWHNMFSELEQSSINTV